MSKSINELIIECNEELKRKGVKMQAELRGGKVALRGSFPAKDGSGMLKQARISTDVSASTPLRDARQKIIGTANSVWSEIKSEAFSWHKYSRSGRYSAPSDIVFRFEGHCKESKTKTTFDSAYRPYLAKLKQMYTSEEISLDPAKTMSAVVESYKENSRSRQLACQCFTQMGRLFIDQSFDLKLDRRCQYVAPSSKYEDQDCNTELTDGEILQAFRSIPNPGWQFAFSLMAVYGLRNHEVFMCDFSELFQHEIDKPCVRVLDGTKTGGRVVLPFPPQWLEEMNMRDPHNQLPPVSTDLPPQRQGQRVSRQFRRYSIPFKPYDLRHNHIVRMTTEFSVPLPVAAKMAGHSVNLMMKAYHRVLSSERALSIAREYDTLAG